MQNRYATACRAKTPFYCLKISAFFVHRLFSNESADDKIAAGTLLLNRSYISDIADYLYAIKPFGDSEITNIGYPSADGGHAILKVYLPMGITESCENKEYAWNFIASFLSEEFQNHYMIFQFPTRLSLLQKTFDTYTNQTLAYQDQQLTQEDLTILLEAIQTGVGQQSFNLDIWNIIREESEYYFNDEKSLREVQTLIQKRVTLYVTENQ